MTTNGLPAAVVSEDRMLEAAARTSQEQLAHLRWHWTLDETNPDRVGWKTYATQVGRDVRAIKSMAEGYKTYKSARAGGSISSPPGGIPTLSDHIALANASATRGKAAQLIADANGIRVSNVLGNRRSDVAALVATAEQSATRRGTTVDEELERHVEVRAKASKARANRAEEAKARKDLRYVEIEGDIAASMRHLNKILSVARSADLSAEHIELITSSLANLRALLGLIDMALVGSVDVDWDSELAKLGGVA